jgi:hypothetical protein
MCMSAPAQHAHLTSLLSSVIEFVQGCTKAGGSIEDGLQGVRLWTHEVSGASLTLVKPNVQDVAFCSTLLCPTFRI